MKLWTIQTEDAYERLKRTGHLYGDWRRVQKDFKPSYLWLCEQMETRGIPMKGRPPIWAWGKPPDLRSKGYLPAGEKGVRLGIEVPPASVLASNFEAWHCVLNNYYCFGADEDYDKDWSEEESRDSWVNIFDLPHCKRAGYGHYTQFTFPILLADYIKSAKRFGG